MKAQVAALRPMLIALGLALLVGAVMMLVSGSNPITGYAAILEGSLGSEGWSTTVTLAILVVGSALAVALPLRAGLVNLGGEGQLVGGGITAVLVATAFFLACWLFAPRHGVVTSRVRRRPMGLPVVLLPEEVRT